MSQMLDLSKRETLQMIGAQLYKDRSTGLWVRPPSSENPEAVLCCQAPPIAKLAPVQYAFGWAAEWARIGYPLIQPSHTYGAALMATQVPRDMDIRPPWSTFMVSVPDGLVHLVNRAKEEEPVRFMLCFWQHDRWTFVAPALSVEYSRTCLTLDKLSLDRLEASGGWDWSPEALAMADRYKLETAPTLIDEQDERAGQCLSRLLLNACIAMSDPTAVKQVGKSHQWKPGAPLPKSPRVFELHRPVNIDCRPTIRRFISTGTRLPSVQWLVRGHWRNQAHGAGHSQRRLTWIEPHWKGAEDAPLAVRPYTLKGPPTRH